MFKFKVGDMVKIRDNLIVNKCYGDCLWTDGMGKFAGKVEKIAEIRGENYKLENTGSWYFSDEMLESVYEEKIIITTDNGEMVARLYKNGEMVWDEKKKVLTEDTTKFLENIVLTFKRLKGEEYYSGKVVAVESCRDITKGKIYEVNQGQFKNDAGKYCPMSTKVMSIEDLNDALNPDTCFIEIVE